MIDYQQLYYYNNYNNYNIYNNYYSYNNFNENTTTKKTIQCLNCGYHGHTIKTCNYPVTSYGIICYHKDTNNNIKYLLIQRKDSLCYIEFIRGKYNLDKLDYICRLFKFITKNEKNIIKNNNFDSLWNKLWKNYEINKFKKEYNESKKKFNKIKNGFLLNDKLIDLDYILDKSQNNIEIYNKTEWEFPKGRRNINENNIKCAIREFEEETGLSKNKINIINNKSYEEIYIAVNNIRYRHIYYIAKCFDPLYDLYNPLNKTQIKEVKDVKWLNYDEVIDSIRKIYIERIELFKRIHKIINKHELKN